MAAGVDVVKQTLGRDFGSVNIDEGWNSNTEGTILRFNSENRTFSVEVSREI
jgi:hypothetical protein